MIAVDYVANEIIPASTHVLWIETFLGISIFTSFLSLLLCSIAVYFEFIHQKELLYYEAAQEEKTKSFRAEKKMRRKSFIDSPLTSTQTERSKSLRSTDILAVLINLIIPGGFFPKPMVAFGKYRIKSIEHYILVQ